MYATVGASTLHKLGIQMGLKPSEREKVLLATREQTCSSVFANDMPQSVCVL